MIFHFTFNLLDPRFEKTLQNISAYNRKRNSLTWGVISVSCLIWLTVLQVYFVNSGKCEISNDALSIEIAQLENN